MAYEVHGIDASHFQGNIDWPAIKDQGVSFAFIKATEGLNHQDTMFKYHWKAIKMAHLIRGAYHFYIPEVDPVLQAQNFLINVSLSNGDLPPVLDMEITDHEDAEKLVKDLQLWLSMVEKAYHTKPIIYTNLKSYYRFIAGRFPDHPVWIARYSDKAPVLGNNKEWTFWQYTDRGKLDGIKQYVDLNAFIGTYQELIALCIRNLPASDYMEIKRKVSF